MTLLDFILWALLIASVVCFAIRIMTNSARAGTWSFGFLLAWAVALTIGPHIHG